ncbi:MAG: tetratricopeptide repeat protein [Candidatus Hydrogenedentes bacterium]|nr:tetratricopeptide repeat protein [Candidatus Hydrogenedentota bacterium]
MGRVDDAITWFRKAIEIDPRSVPARLNWGRVLASQKRYAEACDQFAEALKISPQNVAAREALEAARGALQGTGPSVHNPAVTIEDLR